MLLPIQAVVVAAGALHQEVVGTEALEAAVL
jgi:hypothetical protein